MPNCYSCNTSITEANESEEHILINAVGGRLKSKHLICRSCNNSLGEGIDAELAKQTNMFANMLNIQRERGEPQSITVDLPSTGDKWKFEAGGKPRISKPEINTTESVTEAGQKEVKIEIVARDKGQLREILNGLQRKFGSFDLDAMVSSAESKSEYVREKFHLNLTFGGREAFRAITKSAVGFYLHSGGDVAHIVDAISFVKDTSLRNRVWIYYPDDDPILDRKNEIFHSMIVKGSASEGILYAYVEYFSALNYVVLLSDSYIGSEFSATYFYDPKARTQIHKQDSISFEKTQLLNLINSEPRPYENIVKQQTAVMQKIAEIQFYDHLEELYNNSLADVMSKYSPGTKLDQSIIDKVTNDFSEKLAKFFVSRLPKEE